AAAGASAKRYTWRSRGRAASFRCLRRTRTACECWPTRSSVSSRRLMPSRAVIFLRRRTTSGGARRVRSRRCAGRITLAMFEPRLPFEEDNGTPEAHGASSDVRGADVRGVRLQPDLDGEDDIRLKA